MYHNLLTAIKNAQAARKKIVRLPYSNASFAILKALTSHQYIKEVKKKIIEKKSFVEIELFPWGNDHQISGFKFLSKPSRRFYVGYKTLRPVKQGYGVGFLSTPLGILTNEEARKKKVGGEYLFEVW
ncbi:MAG: 30S ribosomal protein S8 [Patescibacteria group bacterium]